MADNGKPFPWGDYLTIFFFGILCMPAMWAMAYLYPMWETWIKENGDLPKYPWRMILFIPVSIIVGLAMIIYTTMHPTFEKAVKNQFGTKLF